jgi:hypothetical protein
VRTRTSTWRCGLAEAEEAGVVTGHGHIGEGVAPDDSDDPQRDRIFDGFVDQVGGWQNVVAGVLDHATAKGRAMGEDEAVEAINEWRLNGIPYNISLGEWLDGVRITRPED